MLEIFFIICLEVALLAAAFLYVYNSIKKGVLNDSPAIRRAKQEALDGKTSGSGVVNKIVDSPLSPDEDDGKVSHA
jgi:hypothetical protein